MHNISRSIFEGLAYTECIASCWGHQSVIVGIQNEMRIYSGSEWKSLRFRLTCPQFCADSGGKIKCYIEAVNKCGAHLLCLCVVSTTSLGIKLSSFLLNKSYV